ncbi:unnamed protein product, partial [Rotaria sp. Silwood2]
VRGMCMGSPEILKLVGNCPKGIETLITPSPPSPELAKKVQNLYHK